MGFMMFASTVLYFALLLTYGTQKNCLLKIMLQYPDELLRIRGGRYRTHLCVRENCEHRAEWDERTVNRKKVGAMAFTLRVPILPASECGQGQLHHSQLGCRHSYAGVLSLSVCFDNAVRATVAYPIDSLAVNHRCLLSTPVCLFGGFFGREKKDPPPKLEFEYHDSTPPFPRSLISNTFLAGKELRCCYKASVDGFSAAQFHERCDFKGPCVIVGTTEKGVKFGAFNPEGYRSTDDYCDTFDAFLFYWPSNEPETSPIILKKVGGSGAALFDYARGGPQFGADGLLVGPPLAPVMGGFAGPDTNSGVGQLSEARSRLGLSYAKRPDGKDSLFGEDKKVNLVEIEVFCSPAIADLY